MPTYEITAPDGRQLEIEGDTPPTEQDLDRIFADMPDNNTNALTNIQVNEDGSLQQPLQGEVTKRKYVPGQEFFKGIAQGVSSLGVGLGKQFGNKMRAMVGKAPLSDEELSKAYGILDEELQTPSGKVGKFIGEIAPTFLLPEVKAFQGAGTFAKVGNMGLTGAYQGGVIGGLDSLKNQGDLSGVGIGSAIGSALGTSIPALGAIGAKATPWIAERAGSAFGGISPETLKQAIKPNSRALDLTANEAENLLMNTTERIRNAYNNLLNKRGQVVNDAVENLRGNEYRIPVQDLQQDISSIFDQYGGDLINPARNMTGKLEKNLNELIASGSKETPLQGISGATDITQSTISPIDLEKAKQQIGNMTNWDDITARNYQNPILEQIYGKYNNRLSQLSPELKLANEEFANLRNFQKNEGLRSILKSGDSIDSASKTLKNYNSTVTKGNTGRNIRDLENTLVNEGYAPFLNDIDDINATMDLLNSRTTGRNFLGATDLAKSLLINPTLRGIRGANRAGIPALLERTGKTLDPYTVRLLMSSGYALGD